MTHNFITILQNSVNIISQQTVFLSIQIAIVQ